MKIRQRYIYTLEKYSIKISRNWAMKIRQRYIYTREKYITQTQRNLTTKIHFMDLKLYDSVNDETKNMENWYNFNYFIF